MPLSKLGSSHNGSQPIPSPDRRLGAWHEPARREPPAAPPGAALRGRWSAVAVIVAALGTASLVMARTEERQTPATSGGAADQHSCQAMVGKTVLATNQIDFNLRAAQALQYGCLEIAEGGLVVHHEALFGHITHVVKMGIDKR
jgi:hypothetical protein